MYARFLELSLHNSVTIRPVMARSDTLRNSPLFSSIKQDVLAHIEVSSLAAHFGFLRSYWHKRCTWLEIADHLNCRHTRCLRRHCGRLSPGSPHHPNSRVTDKGNQSARMRSGAIPCSTTLPTFGRLNVKQPFWLFSVNRVRRLELVIVSATGG